MADEACAADIVRKDIRKQRIRCGIVGAACGQDEVAHCTAEAAIAVIGGKYKAIIIWWLNEKGVMRYSEIQRRVPQATAKMLSQQLHEMESDGIISRKVYPVVPPKTEYALTNMGKATVPIVHAMDKWGADFFTQLGVPIPCDEE